MTARYPAPHRRRLDDLDAKARAARRRDSRLCRWSYASGALIVVVNILGLLFGVLDWAVVVPSTTLAAVLVLAGLNHGRLW